MNFDDFKKNPPPYILHFSMTRLSRSYLWYPLSFLPYTANRRVAFPQNVIGSHLQKTWYFLNLHDGCQLVLMPSWCNKSWVRGVSLLQVPHRGSDLGVRFSFLEDIQGMSHFFSIVWTFHLTRFIIISGFFIYFSSLDCRQFKRWCRGGRLTCAVTRFCTGVEEPFEYRYVRKKRNLINDLLLFQFINLYRFKI